MNMSRREFIGASAGAAGAAGRPTKDDISLAAWSLNRSFFVAHRWKNLILPQIAREIFGINGLELVNQFFEAPVTGYLDELKRNAERYGVTLVLIMVDGEGDMSARDKSERIAAAVAHRKWVDIAHYLGCHAIRCNMGGPRENWKEDRDLVSRAAESFSHLLEYARGAGLNILIENHGGASSDADVAVALMKAVNDPDFGTLPDFGNVNPGDDHAEVIRKIVPYAKGVSVKSSWNPDGTHTRFDLEKLVKICQDAGYHGFWGIESGLRSSGQNLTGEQIWEEEARAVRLTKAVLERTVLKKT
ncbi:MAG: xylose isomerase [Acidobacteria bacterium]|nr:MAG: xylose isomerase [Acidobacteriota bacterium]